MMLKQSASSTNWADDVEAEEAELGQGVSSCILEPRMNFQIKFKRCMLQSNQDPPWMHAKPTPFIVIFISCSPAARRCRSPRQA